MTNDQIRELIGMPIAEKVEGCSKWVKDHRVSYQYFPYSHLCPLCGYHLYEDEFWHLYFCIKCNKRFKIEE